VSYGVLLTDDANRGLENLPPEGRQAVLAALEHQLEDLAAHAERREVDGLEYLITTVQPWAHVIFRPSSPDEVKALRSHEDGDPRHESFYTVLVLRPLSMGPA
jgi:plasmid stabilization system protein ParE